MLFLFALHAISFRPRWFGIKDNNAIANAIMKIVLVPGVVTDHLIKSSIIYQHLST